MATSGTISTTIFNTRRVIDTAFRRCRLPAQKISSEMQDYAKDALHLILSNIANDKPPSWCIERVVLPIYRGEPTVELPLGTVSVLNLNYRTLQQVSGEVSVAPGLYQVDFQEEIVVSNFGIRWAAASVELTLQTSDDDILWSTVGTVDELATDGDWVWYDISRATAHRYFRVTAASPIVAYDIVLGNTPTEIPMGVLNRDQFVQQSNKIFESRPNSYWYQRDIPQPILHLWPAPNEQATYAQLILWRQRHIMDVGTLQQEIDVPQRWLEAIIASLAAKLAEETPEVDGSLTPSLEAKASAAMIIAREGDNDGSPTYYQPYIACYTR